MMSAPNTDSDGYSQRIQFYSEDVPRLLSQNLGRANWESCLDLGCGDGALLRALNQQGYLQGKSVYALDMSESRIDLVRKISNDFECSIGDAGHTGFENGSIDFVVSTQVIEHVQDDGDMVKEIYRILSPNGMVYISTVFKKKYAWYFYRCNGKWTIDPTHLREYTKDEELLPLFTQHGFEILETKKTLDSRPIMDAILRRIGAGRSIYSNRLLRLLRRIRVPIPGYYNWEIVCRKT